MDLKNLLKRSDKATIPETVSPMLASVSDSAFNDEEWIFEFKYDGYRAITVKKNSSLKLLSRNGKSYNSKFSPVAEALKDIHFDCVLDGEVVVLDEKGIPRIKLVENFGSSGKGIIQYQVFDILFYSGHDLRNLSVVERKEVLKKVLPESEILYFCDYIPDNGIDFFKVVKEKNLEGIVAKKKSSIYKDGIRTKDWLKIPVKRTTDAIVIGYTIPKKVKMFGSLVLATNRNGKMEYLGHSGGLFTNKEKKEIYDRLTAIEVDKQPIDFVPEDARRGVQWVKPQYVCEVQYREITSSGKLRLPVFQRMRYDKEPNEVMTEGKPVEAKKEGPKRKLNLTHLDKVLFPEHGYTKQDLVDYYQKISAYILPYLKDRPQSLRRNVNGYHKKSIFSKNVEGLAPDWIERIPVYTEKYKKEIDYMLCNNLESLLWMVQIGCIEINPWHSSRGSLRHPDYGVIDLDPVKVDFQTVVEVAMAVDKVLRSLSVKAFLKTSGSKGLHIFIPLGAKYELEQVLVFTELLSTIIQQEVPDISSLEVNPKNRVGKVYLDFRQNHWTRTLASVYCVRPRLGASVSTPLKWEELNTKFSPKDFDIKTIFKRIEKVGDLFDGLLKEEPVKIEEVLKKIGR